MSRRKLFKGISHDIIESFVSRYNDINGYWALGQYVNFLQEAKETVLIFNLKDGTIMPQNNELIETAQYYWEFILHMMKANKMPDHWLQDAKITFSIEPWVGRYCSIEITSDLNKVYHYQRSVSVQPHDPRREQRSCRGHRVLSQKHMLD